MVHAARVQPRIAREPQAPRSIRNQNGRVNRLTNVRLVPDFALITGRLTMDQALRIRRTAFLGRRICEPDRTATRV